jgi:hypothetical protein
MSPEVKGCLEAVRALHADAASAVSPQSLEILLTELHADDSKLSEKIKARSGQFTPRAPIYLFLHDIVTFCCVVYSVYDVVGKVDQITSAMVDRDVQISILDRALAKLRKFGLSCPAEKLETILSEVLEYLTRPRAASVGQANRTISPASSPPNKPRSP